MRNITCDDIRQTLEAGATLLDVRTAAEFKVGSLPNAKNIPLTILPLLAHEQIEKEKGIYLLPYRWTRSHR